MKTTKKILSLMLAVLMCFSCMFVPTYAATSMNYSPYPKVEYSYSSGVTVGTIRYIAQNPTSPYFNWNYWPRNSFGGYGSPESECGTACISMALSYVGVDRTPKVLLESTNGYTGSMWGQQGNASSKSISKSTSAVSNAMNDYINGNGKYSPLCVYIVPFSSTSSMHWVLLVGKIDNNKYLALNPWHTSGTNGTFVIQINGTTATYNGTTNPISSINQWHNPNASIPSSEPTNFLDLGENVVVKFASAVGNNMYLDFACSSNNVQIYENCDGHSNPDFVKSQYFRLSRKGDGWYSIVNMGNGKAMDVWNADSSSGTNIQQYEENGTNAQLFRIYDAGNGYCYIKSKLGTYVDVANGNNVNNTNVWAYAFNDSNAQKWKIVQHSHTLNSGIKVQATCTSTGIGVISCYCGLYYENTIAKKAHTYTSTITTNPTCKTDGIRTYKCSCGDSYTQNIGKHPATHVGGTEIRNARASTCKDTGYTGDTYCKGCGVCLGFGTSIAKNYNNHTGGTTINNAKTATCTSEGYTGDTYCKGCNTKLSSGKAIAKNPHNSSITIPAVSATCTETGLSEGKKCSVCGTVTVVQQTVGKKAHSYTSSVTTQPTCTKDGVRTYKCSCGASYIETIAKYGHNSNTTIPTVAATCTKAGLTAGKKCSNCGTITVAQQTVATVSHIDNNGDYRCDFNCGYEFDKPVEPTPEVPEEPDTPNKDCSCMCHKTGLIGIIWKILRFFYKIFKINPVCGCGVNHY